MTDHTTNRSTRRGRAVALALGTLAVGAGLSASPAMAATQSTCAYNESNQNVIINDFSASANLRLFTDGGVIGIVEDPANRVLCRSTNPAHTADLKFIARVTNTERITVFAAPQHVAGGYTIDQNNGRFAPGLTKETDGDSEIEITLNTTGTPAELTVIGTPQRDVMSVGTGGRINFAYDADADVEPQTVPSKVVMHGAAGNDEIDSNGGGIFSAPAEVEVDMTGDAGNDSIVHAGLRNSVLRGGFGEDRLFSANGHVDGLTGGPGFDTATVDKFDGPSSFPFADVEQIHVLDTVGQLRLAPAAVDADAGKPARLELRWTHPKAWKQLRTVKLLVSQGADVKGTITIRPNTGRLSGDGAATVIARDSTLTHHGKTVTADLAVGLSRSLAGQDLRVDVQATDRDGHTQLEPQAGVIRLGN